MRDRSDKRNLLLAAVCISLSASMNVVYADDLWDAINNAASSGYTLSGDYSLPDGKSSLGELQSSNFTLEGNNYKVLLNEKPGIFIDDNHTMTIQNAIIENARTSDEDGSAISNDGTLTITNSKFNNNRTSAGMGGANNYTNSDRARGGAIYNNDEIGTINGNFEGNKTNKSGGGAIYNNGTITSIIGNFKDNSAGFYGGAIYNYKTIGSISGDFTDNSASSCGGAIYNGGTITSISGNFTGNIAKEYESGSTGKLYGEGAAIHNEGTITSINANFTSNQAEGSNSRGGAIYNRGTITSISGDFEGNSANQEGGAIWYEHANASGGDGKIETINSNFIRNTAGTKGGAIYIKQEINSITGNFTSNTAGQEGGAIYNNNDEIGSITGDFTSNTAGTKGGAIYNTDDDITSISGNFTSNSASSDGGAIWNGGRVTRGTISTITGDFTNNSSGGSGGAIYNNDGLGTITGDFTNNSASGQGGAVWNDDTINQITGSFRSNYSKGLGGAIYNNCDLYIVTDDEHDIIFSGNKQNVTSITRDADGNITSVEGGESNAIYNEDYVEFNAKHGRAIYMYDKLADVDNYNWEWVKTGGGTLALGEDMSGIVGDVWIKEGIVKLVQNDRDSSVYGTGFSNADDVTYENNVYIDSQNNHIDNFHLGNDVTLEGTLHALIDVNLADEPTADKIIAGDDVDSGSIVIDSIIIITGGGSFETPRNVLIADEHTRGIISLGSGITISGEGKTNWTLGYTPTTGILNFSGNVTLKEVANAATPATRVFSAAGDEILAENIGNINNENANLTVRMNNHAINGQSHSGFVTTASTQKLTINDANVGNFNSTENGSFIYDNNGAEININNSTFMNNEAANGGIIYSSGKLTLTDSSFINNKISGYGGAIYSKGDVTVNAINEDVEFAGNYDDSNLITNAIYMEGTAENPITLTLNSKNSENEVSIDDKLDGSYYDIVINGAEDSLGDVVFYNEVNTGSLTVSKGLLENNGIVTVTSGKNNGTITCDNNLSDVNGYFTLNDGGSETPLVFDNNGSFTQNSLTIESGEFRTNASNLHLTDDIVNKDILNLEGGNLSTSVSGAGTAQITGDVGFANIAAAISQAVDIKSTGKLTADTANLTGTLITNDGTLIFNNTNNGLIGQNISGSSATSNGIVEIATANGNTISLNGKSITDNSVKLTSGTFNVAANADDNDNIDISSMGLIANGGTLSVQDDKTGTITLGNINTTAGNLNLSIDLDLVNQEADKLTQKTGTSITGGNKINLKEIALTSDSGTVTPDDIMIADTTITTSNLNLEQTTISGENIGNLLLTFTSDTEGSYLHTEHSDIENAITSSITTKMYSMGESEPTIDNLTLGGTSLSITTNGNDIVSTSNNNSANGIIIANSGQILSITGTVDDVSGNPETTISGFDTAIDNSAGGTVNLTNIELSGNETDIANAGSLNLDGINSIDTIADNTTPAGTTTVKGGTSAIGSLLQKAVKILSGGTVNIDADKLSTTDGTDNQGILNLGGGNLASNITDSQTTKTGVTNIKDDVTNSSGKTISQKSVTIDSSSSLTTAADKVTTADGISNAGKLNLTGGSLASDVIGEGTTNISGDVDTNGKTITQTDVNIGQNGSGAATTGKLINNNTISATNVNITTAGALDNSGTISATTIANTGTANFKTGSDINATDITTSTDSTTNFTGGNVDATNIINNGGNTSITGGSIIANAINNTSTTADNDINITGGTVVANTIENSGAGSTAISGGSVTANTSITNSGSGSIDISSTVKTPLVAAANGTVNINAIDGQTATSNLLKDVAGAGAADITASAGATVNINTNSSTIVVDNNVSGAGILNLNGDTDSEFYISPNAIVSSAINIAAGQLNTGNGSNITGPISVAADATLNTMNGGYSTFDNTTFSDGANLKVDVNAISDKSDNFINPNEPRDGYEYLTDLSIQDMHKIVQNSKSINLSKTIGLNNLQSSDDLIANLNAKYSSVLTPIRKMNANVEMTPEGLMLNIAGTGNKYKDFNPAVMASPVAAQMGGYLTQLQSYDEAFHNMDMYMLMTESQRQALKYKNKIASIDGGVLYDSALMRQEKAEGWFRPYTTFEKVRLKNGPKVENQAYGSYFGGESEMYDLGHGWDGMWGAYVGYNGSHQHYDGVSIYQNGGTLGVLGMAYKGNFFTGLTLNAGASAAEAHTMYGHEDITMLMTGIASKTGYNWELFNGKFIIQPSWLMSYSFVNTFDYTNAAGVRMHSSPLNAIQLQPELKFIGNLKNSWQPYASVAMVWNIMDDTKFKANDVTLPELSVKPFVKYGVGLRKIWGERFTGFFQTYITNGGRNGVGLQAGFTWALGGGKNKKADEQKIQKSLNQAPELKKTKITLNSNKA